MDIASLFIAKIAVAAQACQRTTGIPASITIAQAALETGWGVKAIGCNLFNIKADKSWGDKPVTLAPTTEYVNGVKTSTIGRFRCYKSWTESMLDRAAFLKANPRYAPCFKQTTAAGWAQALQVAGFATDPTYADKLMAVIRGRNLTQYDTK